MKTELEEEVSRTNVSYIVYESATARLDRIIKRLWIIILVLIFLLVGSNIAWLYYEQQFTDEITVTQENDGEGHNNYVDGDAEIHN